MNALCRALALPACLLVACGLACGQGQSNQDAPREGAAKPAALTTPKPNALPPAARPSPTTSAALDPVQTMSSKPGWSKLTIQDEVPLCVFASLDERDKATELSKVTAQTLSAKSTAAFGAFGPWCVNEACDALPTLQCTVERDGDTLVVHSLYWGFHKDGAKCTEDCRPVLAGCETPVLEAGAYKVAYGDKIFPLKIPSVLQDPCIDRD